MFTFFFFSCRFYFWNNKQKAPLQKKKEKKKEGRYRPTRRDRLYRRGSREYLVLSEKYSGCFVGVFAPPPLSPPIGQQNGWSAVILHPERGLRHGPTRKCVSAAFNSNVNEGMGLLSPTARQRNTTPEGMASRSQFRAARPRQSTG